MQDQNTTKNGNRQEVIARDSEGRAKLIQANGHTVELTRLDAYDLILTSCYDAESGEPCEINTRGFCAHCLAGIFAAAADAGVCVTTCVHQEVAEALARQVGGRVLLARSDQTPHGEGRLWVVAGKGNGKAASRDPEQEYHQVVESCLSGLIDYQEANRRLAGLGYDVPKGSY